MSWRVGNGSLKVACRVCIRSWLLAKDSEVKGKPLQLGRTYRRRTLRKTNTAGKATGNHPWQIRDTSDCECAAAPFCGVHAITAPHLEYHP